MDIPKKSKEALSKTNRSSLLKLLNKKKPCLNTFKDERMKTNNNTLLVLAWNFYNDIKKNNSELSNNFINIKDLEKIN